MKISTVDVTPTWAGLLPALVQLAAHDDHKVRGDAWAELRRMAKAADHWNNAGPGLVRTLEMVLGDLNIDLPAETAGLIQGALSIAKEI